MKRRSAKDTILTRNSRSTHITSSLIPKRCASKRSSTGNADTSASLLEFEGTFFVALDHLLHWMGGNNDIDRLGYDVCMKTRGVSPRLATALGCWICP
jgi:hypothetical protein